MSFDQSAWAARIRAQMAYEWQREGPPDGFPALPPLPIPLNYQERRIYHLHEEIDRVIGPEKLPEALRVAPRLEPFWES